MREILYRGKATNRKAGCFYRTKYENGDWVYGLITDTKNYAGNAEMTNEQGVQRIEVDKKTVGRFTGLKDKNRKKIFEGDIIKNSFKSGDAEYFVVKWNNAYCRFELEGIKIKECICLCSRPFSQVAGNIYDNPELLGVSE